MTGHVSTDDVALVLLLLAAPPATIYPLLLGLTTKWRSFLMGRALLTKAVGLALLIDVSLAYRLFGADYAGRDPIRLSVFGLVTVGVWMQFWALARQKVREQRDQRHLRDLGWKKEPS